MSSLRPRTEVGARRRICFLYIAQPHQIPHSLPVAVALARGWPDLEVDVAGVTPEHLTFASEGVARLGGAPIRMRLLGPAWLRDLRSRHSIPPKVAMLAANLSYLTSFDAVVTPERTSSLLARLGAKAPSLVYTQHGAGDRAGPFEPRLGAFDLVFAAGPKQRDRMIREGLVQPQNCTVVGYPKFELIDALAGVTPRPFTNERPTVLYNPHFDATLSSWPEWGRQVLTAFAAQDRYNLIFAPHIRLFDGASRRRRQVLEPFAKSPSIHVDVDSLALADMTYTEMADIYVGDASSQVYEFLRQPRPCVFLNAHGADWIGQESYRHWHFGPVVDQVKGLIEAIDRAVRDHHLFVAEQTSGLRNTIEQASGPASHRAAKAIADRLLGPARAQAAQ